MKISGFSMVRNGIKLYYPVVEMILSALPLVDEFIIAVGAGDTDDDTRQQVAAIRDPKISIIDTVWDLNKYPRGMENAHQTDIAKNVCQGDWLLYLQADEVIHEAHIPVIRNRCRELLNNTRVEGLLFKYLHFWGDYRHYQKSHGWYPYEIRIIRNDPDIHSWESAQSFRRIPEFDGINYRQQENTHKLQVAQVDAYIFHYGWVRPPHLMQDKRKALDTVHKGLQKVNQIYSSAPGEFDFGPLDRLAVYTGSHPAVMKEMINRLDWQDKLQMQGKPDPRRRPHKHELPKYRWLTWIEHQLLAGKQLGGFTNYHLLKGI